MNIDENLTINIRIPWYMYKSQINYTQLPQSKAAQELTITVITHKEVNPKTCANFWFQFPILKKSRPH